MYSNIEANENYYDSVNCVGCGYSVDPNDLAHDGMCWDCYTSAIAVEIEPRTGKDADSVCWECGNEWAEKPGGMGTECIERMKAA